MKAWGVLLVTVVIVLLAYCAGQRQVHDSTALAAKVDTVRLRDSARATVHDTVQVYLPRAAAAKARADSLDAPVTITADSTLTVTRPETTLVAQVPPEVVADLRQLRLTVNVQDTTIHLLRRQTAADSLRIISRDALIREMAPRNWSLGLAAGYGCSSKGCGPAVTVGLTWRP